MKREIERKFLVSGDGWRSVVDEGKSCEQGYMVSDPTKATIRIRRIGKQGFLTVKGPSEGISRAELEYEIPVAEAEYMLEHFCGDRVISKRRYLWKVGELCWEVDEFFGVHQGLVLAEIELEHEDQPFAKPEWVGKEVSLDPRYFNAVLAQT